jgi:hypothetical protein
LNAGVVLRCSTRADDAGTSRRHQL